MRFLILQQQREVNLCSYICRIMTVNRERTHINYIIMHIERTDVMS
jgi:hypothetical protein